MAKVMLAGKQEFSGRVGGNVFVNRKDGISYVRAAAVPHNPRTERQCMARTRLTVASRTYRNMTLEQAELWRMYCLRLEKEAKGSSNYRPLNVFNALAIKYQEVNPEQKPPLTPPEAPFLGDSVNLTAEGGIDLITFTADRPNGAGVVTELLTQRLQSVHRTPQPGFYRSQAFVEFQDGALIADLEIIPGIYAVAYRFILRSTGQSTPIQPLCKVQVQYGG